MRFLFEKKNLKISLLLLAFHIHAGAYRAEGVYTMPDGENRFFLVRLFTPYNPKILAVNCNANAPEKCKTWWPQCSFFSEAEMQRDQPYDFVWIESEGDELAAIQKMPDILKNTLAIYTTTHFFNQGEYFQDLLRNLDSQGFTLLSHWYYEGEKGNAIFLKKEIYYAALNTLYYHPRKETCSDRPSVYDLEKHFRKAGEKPEGHSYEEIDYIYMINIDERPEKFAKAAKGLELWGIHPYRFSAVKGWELSLESINELGLKFPQGSLKESFMGSVYYEVDGVQYRSHEIIEEDGRTYFANGLSQGAIGICLSHLSVLQDAYDSGYETIWVMEDDVDVLEDPSQIPVLLRDLDQMDPEWDIFFTDTDTKDTNGYHVPCRGLAARPNFCIEPLETFLNRFYPLNGEISRIGMRYGAYSMILRRPAIEKILNHFKSYGIFLPYDMDFWLIPNMKMYSSRRDIISHAVGAPTDNNHPNYKDKK